MYVCIVFITLNLSNLHVLFYLQYCPYKCCIKEFAAMRPRIVQYLNKKIY